MKRSKIAQLKYVEILACYKILNQVRITPTEPVKDVLRAVGADGSLGGSLPVVSGFELTLAMGKVVIDGDSRVELSDGMLETLGTEASSEPSNEFLQELIRSILNEHKLPWVIFCNLDVVKFRAAIPANWEIILENCGLLNFDDYSILKWWRSLLYKYNQEKKLRLKKIGDIGESLTLSFEQDRIQNAKYDHTILVSWAASIDDELGFDIISIYGAEYEGEDKEEIYIEVKSSERESTSEFSFYVSRNEWEVAKEYGDAYFFYCWVGVKSNGDYHKGPFVFKADQISRVIPIDQDKRGQWRNSRITVDLEAFDILKSVALQK